ncbi:hypothetical protein HOO65_090334 [Ceratocystis lukuohia]|uniref:HTH CENPB-type domain-containing protein n=1 Tax=Ceratocystis lukuohia TaxID=2019550 RepID=A0ABR4M9U1_9PEZI
MEQPKNEANIVLTLWALQTNPELGLRPAARLYQVDYHALHHQQNGIQCRCNTIPNSRRLSDLEEQVIVKFIHDLDLQGYPLQLRGVEEMANQLLTEHDASPVGKHWASNFVKRQPDLKARFSRRYDYKRAKCEDPAIIRSWFTLVENTIAKYSVSLTDVYNFDGTGFMMDVIASGIVITGTERRGKAKSLQHGNQEWVTVLQAITAEGWVVALFIVVAGQCHLSS